MSSQMQTFVPGNSVSEPVQNPMPQADSHNTVIEHFDLAADDTTGTVGATAEKMIFLSCICVYQTLYPFKGHMTYTPLEDSNEANLIWYKSFYELQMHYERNKHLGVLPRVP